MSKAFKDSRMAIADIDRAMSISDITKLWSMLIGIVAVFIGLVMVWGMWRGSLVGTQARDTVIPPLKTARTYSITSAIPSTDQSWTPTDYSDAGKVQPSPTPL